MSVGALGDRGTIDSLVRRYQLDPSYGFNMSPEVVATASLGAMDEIRFQMGWWQFQRALSVGPVGAQFGRSQLRAAVNGVMVVVEGIFVSTSVAFSVQMAIGGTPDLAGASQRGVSRDFRQPASSTAIVSQDTNAVAVTSSFFDGFGAANSILSVPGGPWILTDVNDALVMSLGPVNTGFSITWVWRERRMNDQENTI